MIPLETQQIEAAKKLAGLPRMDGSPWGIYLPKNKGNGITPFISHRREVIKLLNGRIQDEMTNIDLIELGKYLKIEDGNPWSSSAILARAGWYTLIHPRDGWCIYKFYDPVGRVLVDHNGDKIPQEHQELANNLGIIKLHEINPEAYAVGMEILLEKE